MDFDITPDQLKRAEEIRNGVRDRLDGAAPDGPQAHFTRDKWQAAAQLGLTGLCLPAEHGGAGLGALDTALCLEAFGRTCRDTGLVFGVAAHLLACGVPIRDFAGAGVRADLLGGLASGDVIAANAITEDDAGSDVSGLRMTAVQDGEDYVLDGEKSFSSNAPLADLVVTYAVTEPSGGFFSVTGFAVPRDLPGVTVVGPFAKMGLHGCPAGRVRFDSCRVPARYRLGDEGQGRLIFQHSMGWERACLFAIYLGLMDHQLERCVQHARSRRQFGHGIGEFQAISHRIATMKQRLESSRLLLYRACWLMDQGRDHVAAASLSKIAVSEAAVANGIDAVQIFGGSGYLSATGIESQLRDSVPSTIFSGTTEIHREIVAKEAGL
jgi:L-prolyl-[peptidyl-carrier protein] dehydrogenase